MRRSLSLVSLIAITGLTACGNEGNFRDDLFVDPSYDPRPVDAETQTDVFVQTVTPTVDVLYMVDNSCSMGDDQADLAANFPTFMRWFLGSGLDYHIGVVSSDMVDPAHKGKLQRGFGKLWIETDDPNQIAQFQQAAVLGNSGASPERGIAGIYFGAEKEADRYNDGFFRDTSAIHTIAVSDERDFSQGDIPMNEFIPWYDQLKRSADERTFSAIESPSSGASGAGQRYATVTRAIGGVEWDIGDADWSPALDRIGIAATGRKTEYFLSKLPVDPTIRVTVRTPILDGADYDERIYPRAEYDDNDELVDENGDPATGEFWYYVPGRNSITFVEYVPEDLAQVVLEYTVRSSVVDPLDRNQ